jgi:periplasmic divalent cation tolerance protein
MPEAYGELIVLTTVANTEQASALARSILAQRLAACVTCLPGGLSFFRWQSEAISEEAELVLLIKTHKDKLADLQSHFEQEHPYEVPEFVVLDIAQTSAAYGNWLRSEMGLKSKGDA